MLVSLQAAVSTWAPGSQQLQDFSPSFTAEDCDHAWQHRSPTKTPATTWAVQVIWESTATEVVPGAAAPFFAVKIPFWVNESHAIFISSRKTLIHFDPIRWMLSNSFGFPQVNRKLWHDNESTSYFLSNRLRLFWQVWHYVVAESKSECFTTLPILENPWKSLKIRMILPSIGVISRLTWIISLSRCRSIEDPLIVRSMALSAWNFPARSSPRHRLINLATAPLWVPMNSSLFRWLVHLQIRMGPKSRDFQTFRRFDSFELGYQKKCGRHRIPLAMTPSLHCISGP